MLPPSGTFTVNWPTTKTMLPSALICLMSYRSCPTSVKRCLPRFFDVRLACHYWPRWNQNTILGIERCNAGRILVVIFLDVSCDHCRNGPFSFGLIVCERWDRDQKNGKPKKTLNILDIAPSLLMTASGATIGPVRQTALLPRTQFSTARKGAVRCAKRIGPGAPLSEPAWTGSLKIRSARYSNNFVAGFSSVSST